MPKRAYRTGRPDQGFITAPSDYDGTNDLQLRGAELTGNADGKAGTVSCWLNFGAAGDGTLQAITANLNGGTAGFQLRKNASNAFTVLGKNTGGTSILQLGGTLMATNASGWVSILASWDLAAGSGSLYINDVLDTTATVLTNDTIDYTKANWAIGAYTGAASKLNACLAEMFFHTTFIDLSIIANRRKFINQYGRPVYLGANGSAPLGVQPLIYAPNGDASTNLGSGGNFTTTGALTACAKTPSTP